MSLSITDLNNKLYTTTATEQTMELCYSSETPMNHACTSAVHASVGAIFQKTTLRYIGS